MNNFTRIECSKCGDIVELTVDSLELPFTCGDCLAEVLGLPPISCDTASVENTTALIEDLENQLSLTKQALAIAHEDIKERDLRVKYFTNLWNGALNVQDYYRAAYLRAVRERSLWSRFNEWLDKKLY